MFRELFFLSLLKLVPRLRGAVFIRAFCLRLAGANVGKRVKIKYGLIVEPIGSLGNLAIGDGSFLNTGVRFAAKAKINVGSNCSIGPSVHFETVGHSLHLDQNGKRATYCKQINIGNGVWLGAGVLIMPGVSVGDGAVIASGAVVVSDVPPHSLYGGVPAKKIKSL